LREPVKRAVLGPVLAETGWFNASYLRRLVDDHQSGLRDYSTPLWTLLMFESFLRNVTGASEAKPAMRLSPAFERNRSQNNVRTETGNHRCRSVGLHLLMFEAVNPAHIVK